MHIFYLQYLMCMLVTLPSSSYIYINDKTMQHKLRGTT